MFRKRTSALLASVFVLFLLFIAGSAAAESGFAKVRANATLATFGGPDTVAAASMRDPCCAAGVYQVTFFGAYPPTTTADTVVVNATAESLQWGVSNAVVVSANPAQITVQVWTWQSFTSFDVRDNTFFISVFVGQVP